MGEGEVMLMLTPLQCRIARAGLHLTIRELAARARVSPGTLVRFENGYGTTNHSTRAAIHHALTAAGATFTWGFDNEGASMPVTARHGT